MGVHQENRGLRQAASPRSFASGSACKGISSDENCDVVRRGAVRSPAGIGSPASFARKHAAATAIEALDEARHGPRRAALPGGRIILLRATQTQHLDRRSAPEGLRDLSTLRSEPDSGPERRIVRRAGDLHLEVGRNRPVAEPRRRVLPAADVRRCRARSAAVIVDLTCSAGCLNVAGACSGLQWEQKGGMADVQMAV